MMRQYIAGEFVVCSVKRITAILLTITIVLTCSEFHELMRLPLLVLHYVEHSSSAPELSLQDFLAMHYQTSGTHDNTDASLPFKHDCASSSSVPLVSSIEFFTIPSPESNTQVQYSLERTSHPCSIPSSVWQPPKRS